MPGRYGRCAVVVMVPPQNKMETSGGHQGRVSALGVSLSADTRERLAPLAGREAQDWDWRWERFRDCSLATTHY